MLNEYFKCIQTIDDSIDTNAFWYEKSKIWQELAIFAKHILTIPATSALVERIFSVGGSILGKSRRKLNDDLFEKIIFMKCNIDLFKND